MLYPVRYSSRAYNEYENLLDYVLENFGIAKAAQVDAYIDGIIDLIATNPRLYPYSNKKQNIRRCVISPQTTLYYRFLGECVELASFRGNKMNPDTINL